MVDLDKGQSKADCECLMNPVFDDQLRFEKNG